MSTSSLNYTYLYFNTLDYTNSSAVSSYTLSNTPLKFVPDFTTSGILSGAQNISSKTLRWEFGDGTFSTDLSPSHVYEWPGEYNVALTVYDGSGNAYDSTFTTTVKIYDFIATQISFSDYKSLIYDIPVGKLIDPLTVNAYFSWQSYQALSATGYTINLYASGARGAYNYVAREQNDKWAHLRSLSRFYVLSTINGFTDYVTVESVQPIITPIYVNIQNNQLQLCQETDAGSVLAGITGSSQFWYTDDKPGNLLTESSPIIIFASIDNAKFKDAFTQRTDAYDYISYPPYGYQNINPAVFPSIKTRYNPADHLSITTTGIDGEGSPVDHAFDIPYSSWQNTEIPYVIKFKDDQDFTTKNYPPLSSSTTVNSTIYNDPQPYYDIQTSVVYNSGEGNMLLDGVTFYEDFAPDAPQTIGAFYKGYFVPTQSTENCYLTASVNVIDPPYFRKDAIVNWIAIPQYYSAIRLFREEIINGYTGSTTVAFPNNTFNIAANNTYAITVAPSGVTADSDYRTWFADSVNDQLLQYDIYGNLLTTYQLSAMTTLINNQTSIVDYRYVSTIANDLTAASPNDIALDSKNNLWVSLFDSGKVIKIDAGSGNVVATAAPFSTNTILTSSDYNQLTFNSVSPKAVYNFNGDIKDSSGNNYNLIGNYTAGPSLGSFVHTFDSTKTPTLTYPTSLWSSPQDFSVSFWFSPGGTNPFPPDGIVIIPTGNNYLIQGMGFEISATRFNRFPQAIEAYLTSDSGQSTAVTTSTTKLDYGNWYNITLVHDSKQKTLSLYINGTLESKASYTSIIPGPYTGQFSINGAFYAPDGKSYGPGGYYSSLNLWTTALTQDQINYFYQISLENYANLKGFAGEGLSLPSSIDTDTNNNLWVSYTHPDYSTLIKYRGENNFTIAADKLKTLIFPTGFSPEQIQVDRNNNIWATVINHNSQGVGFSNRNDYLYKFDINGNLIPGFPLSGFQQIGNLTIDGDQNAWVVQGAETLTRIDSSTNQTSNYVAGLGNNQTEYICSIGGLTCDTSNNIWVINNFDNALYLIDANLPTTGIFAPKYTIPLSYPTPSLPPVSAFDSDTVAYISLAGITSYAAQIQLDQFIKGIKSLGFWNNMVAWPLRSSQNANGTTAYSLGGLGSYPATLYIPTSAWTSAGIYTNDYTQYGVTNATISDFNHFTMGSFYKVVDSVYQYNHGVLDAGVGSICGWGGNGKSTYISADGLAGNAIDIDFPEASSNRLAIYGPAAQDGQNIGVIGTKDGYVSTGYVYETASTTPNTPTIAAKATSILADGTGSPFYILGRTPNFAPRFTAQSFVFLFNKTFSSSDVTALYNLYTATLGSDLYNPSQILPTGFPPVTPVPNTYSDGLQEFQAIGDWNGYSWLNKYAAPTSTVRTITGSSALFNIYPDVGQFNIAKINENWNASGYYDSLRFQETLLDKQVFFDQFLGVILGGLNAQPYELGKTVYEKIANFVDNNADIDKVNVNELLSFCRELSVEFDQYNIIFPPQLRRLVDLLSIKQSKLWGTQNKYGSNFDPRGTQFPNDEYGINLGSVIDPLTGSFSNGVPIVAQELFSGNYKIVNTNSIDPAYATYNNNQLVTLYSTITTGYQINITGAGDTSANGTYSSDQALSNYFYNTDPNSNYYIFFSPGYSIFGTLDSWYIINNDSNNVYVLEGPYNSIYNSNSNWALADYGVLPTPTSTFTTETSTYVSDSYIVNYPYTVPLSSYTSDWGWGLVAPDISGSQISNYYKFYNYNPVYNNTYYDNIIDWTNPLTTLSQTNSSYSNWSQDNGIIQSLLSYELTKGLKLFTSAANITYNS